MLHQSTFDFLNQLKQNNNKEWFAAHKDSYQAARADFEKLVGELLDAIYAFDPSIGHPEPKKSIFRINRDIRFSTNKEPYKTNFGAMLCAEEHRRSWDRSSFYIHIEDGASFLACGIYGPSAPVLKAIRTAIGDEFDEFTALIHNKDFEKTFGGLSPNDSPLQRVPNGFDKTSPAAEFFKMKHFYVSKPVSNQELFSKNFVAQAAKVFQTALPLSNWLNQISEDVHA